MDHLLAWLKNLFSSILSHFILPAWDSIQKKAGPALAAIIAAGLAQKDNGHTAIFDAIKTTAIAEGIDLFEYEIGFLANALEHPATPIALPPTA